MTEFEYYESYVNKLDQSERLTFYEALKFNGITLAQYVEAYYAIQIPDTGLVDIGKIGPSNFEITVIKDPEQKELSDRFELAKNSIMMMMLYDIYDHAPPESTLQFIQLSQENITRIKDRYSGRVIPDDLIKIEEKLSELKGKVLLEQEALKNIKFIYWSKTIQDLHLFYTVLLDNDFIEPNDMFIDCFISVQPMENRTKIKNIGIPELMYIFYKIYGDKDNLNKNTLNTIFSNIFFTDDKIKDSISAAYKRVFVKPKTPIEEYAVKNFKSKAPIVLKHFL